MKKYEKIRKKVSIYFFEIRKCLIVRMKNNITVGGKMKEMNKKQLVNVAMMGLTALALFMPEEALAQTENARNLKTIMSEGTFRNAITLGFGLFAFVKWVDYFANFQAGGGALTGLIVPGLATFMAFKWTTVLSWFGLF